MEINTAFESIENCLLQDAVPSLRLNEFEREDWFNAYPFSLLEALKNTGQSPVHHPEGNVWNHTLLVVDEAARRKAYSSDSRVFMWAALLHDIGKPAATRVRKGKITAYDHDKLGADIARRFLAGFTDDNGFIDKAAQLVRYHMHTFYVAKDLPFKDMKGLLSKTNINDTALLGFCDRLGRTGADIGEEKENTLLFLQKCGEETEKPWLNIE